MSYRYTFIAARHGYPLSILIVSCCLLSTPPPPSPLTSLTLLLLSFQATVWLMMTCAFSVLCYFPIFSALFAIDFVATVWSGFSSSSLSSVFRLSALLLSLAPRMYFNCWHTARAQDLEATDPQLHRPNSTPISYSSINQSLSGSSSVPTTFLSYLVLSGLSLSARSTRCVRLSSI